MLTLRAEQRNALRSLLGAPKFGADRAHSYAGAPSERIRSSCEAHINDLLRQLLDLPDVALREEALLKPVRRALAHLDAYGSQERDRYCAYLEQIMDALGIEDAAQLLHNWRYGLE
jgi:hypothetical protein